VDELFRLGGDGPVLIGFVLVGRVGPFLQFAVDEDSTGSHQWDEFGAGDAMPAFLGGVEQLVGHGQGGFA